MKDKTMMQMPYFRLHPDKRLTSPLCSSDCADVYQRPLTAAQFAAADEVLIAHYTVSACQSFPDFLYRPVLMVTQPIRELLEELEPAIQFHAVQFLPQDSRLAGAFHPLYWVVYLEPRDVLHETTEWLGTGIVSRLVPDAKKLAGAPIVRVQQGAEEIWLLSLLAAERLLAKRPLGCQLEEVMPV